MTGRFENGFGGTVAVITGGGDGIGRAIALRLASDGCDVALCDVMGDKAEQTAAMSRDAGHPGEVLVGTVDVSDEAQVVAFRDRVAEWRPHVNLLCNIAGVGRGGSFVAAPRDEWERTFGVSWFGVYFNCRAYLPLLMAAPFGHVVNMSSVKSFWASRGPSTPHSAYSTAKAAIRGFTESLITDFRVNAPHLRASVVMPGHVATSITANSIKVHTGHDAPADILEQAAAFSKKAPLSADDAARIILDGVRNEEWRILVGDDAKWLDERVRSNPWDIYEPEFTGLEVPEVTA